MMPDVFPSYPLMSPDNQVDKHDHTLVISFTYPTSSSLPLKRTCTSQRSSQSVITDVYIKHSPFIQRRSCVHLNVRLELVGLHKLSRAYLALIRFVFGVCKHVILQVSVPIESLRTDFALVRFVSGVNDLMAGKAARSCERHVAL